MSRGEEEGCKPKPRLDEITTEWSLFRAAHRGSATAAGPARDALVLRYCGAVHRYIAAIVQNDPDAEDLTQQIVVRMLKGDFAGARPERGRFRDLIKSAVRNMVRNHWAHRKRRHAVDVSGQEVASRDIQDPSWESSWRHVILERTWSALESYQRQQPNSVAWTVLRLRAAYPNDDMETLARRNSEQTGRFTRTDTLRQQLRRARLRFAQLLLEEIARGLDHATPDNVEQELSEIGLMDYVRDFLPEDWRSSGRLRG